MKREKKRNNGFTLIELMVVISIISLLSTVVMTSLLSARQKSRDVARFSDMRMVQTALELYYDENNAYPNTNGEHKTECGTTGVLADEVIPGLAPTYINRIPSDPLMQKSANAGLGDNCYIYLSDGTGYAFVDMGTDINLMSHPDLIDPTRDDPVGNNCNVDGTPTAWKVFSQGWRCN